MQRFLATLFLIAGFAPATAWSQGNVNDGRQTAALWCAPCHASPARTASSDVATPFNRIVETRSREAIAGFLARPHGRMPDIMLSREQIDDVIAYMDTLRKR